MIYEKTSEVKQSHVNLLLHNYELFCILSRESIYEIYTHFTKIIISLNNIGRGFLNSKIVREKFCCFPESWDTNVVMIFKFKDLYTYSIEHLLSSFIAYE